MKLSSMVKEIARRHGYSIKRILPSTDSWARRRLLISDCEIDLVLDIGAHHGSYGKRLRADGYLGTIYSFEPQPSAQVSLCAAADKGQPWRVFPVALSDFEGQSEFFVSARSSSSSLQEMSAAARSMADAQTVDRLLVEVRTVDAVIEEYGPQDAKIYAKCDAQGAERSILKGATRTLENVRVFEVELSIGDMYAGQWDFRDALDYFDDLGFELFSIESGFADPSSGRVMQVDAIFLKKRSCKLE